MHEHAHHLAIDATLLAQYGAAAALFVLGLAGSVTHCVGMCGPFVLGQVANRLDGAGAISEFGRLKAAALLPYHLGRLTTYAALGALAAGLSQAIVAATGFREFLAVMLAMGALVMLGAALGHFRLATGIAAPGRMLAWLRPLFGRPTGLRGYALGLVLGLLPCGLVYGALTVAASTGTAPGGALAMAGFALGTMPALMAAGFAGALAARRWREKLRYVAGPLLLLNAATLGWLAAASLG